VVRTHPVSGRKALFVNSMFTTQIVGLTAKESDALLGFLFEHIAQPQFQCRFRWRKNSMAFWDNRCVQHQAIWDYWPQTRSGYRVTIKGERPV
jgi:taurine dioxygenase